MAHRQVEEEMERLNLLREGNPAEAVAPLRKALAGRINLIVAKAAKLAAEMHLVELLPDLLRTYARLMEKGAERDPQCWGKNAIVKTVVALDYRESEPFVRGIRHIQMEPVWGGEEDTAATLRGSCALALPACTDLGRGDTLRCLVDTLADRALPVRTDGVRAIAQMGGNEAVLLLRLKAQLGDAESEVVGAVFDHLLQLERAAAVPFLAGFLRPKLGPVAEEAALALGSSRLVEAAAPLQDAWTRERDPDFRPVLLRAISATRQPSALEFLLNLVRDGRQVDAVAALDALAMHRDSIEIRRQVKQAAEEREPEVRGQFRQSFARPENA